MTVRSLVPKPLQGAARTTYLAVGGATSAVRMTPEFIVVGGQRCGTTSLFKNIAEHPQVLRPAVDKGIDWFTLHYDRGESWYRSHFPVERLARMRTSRHGRPVAFEACTYYMFHPFAMERLAARLPDVKVVAMLRDPVERAFSAYKHELARGFETEAFDRALDLEDERLAGEAERMVAERDYHSFSYRHHGYVRRGQYAEQLRRMRDHFPAEQIHVVESESFFEQPEQTFAGVLDFLELPRVMPDRFDRWNGRPSSPMRQETRDRLRQHFRSHDRDLAELLGREPAWLL